MRIAWLGPVGEHGGVPSLGTLLLEGALQENLEIDFFTADTIGIPPNLLAKPNLRVVSVNTWWSWNRWYSKRPMLAFLSGTIARMQSHGRLCGMIIDRHALNPYDCIFQLSQSELFKLARHLDELPPVVIFPCVHAAGELRWHRRESAYALQSERAIMHYLVRLLLRFRNAIQRRQMQKPAMILGLSKRFNELLAQDYEIPPERLKVLYHPIRGADGETAEIRDSGFPGRPIKLVFIGRISVRKGFEQIVALSKRLDDLRGQVVVDVIGDKTQWSDYTGHIKELNPRVAKYVGPVNHKQMSSVYDAADILLVPSLYEPGGLVVGEALSRGVSVVASDEVGSAEPISRECCRRFPAGNMDVFEAAVRQLICDISKDYARLRQLARQEAKEHFAPRTVCARLIGLLKEVATTRACSSAPAAQLNPLSS